MRISDWSSDVCPSDLNRQLAAIAQHRPADDAEHDHRRAGTAKDGAAITLGPERCIKEDRLEHLAIDDDEGEQEQEPGRARRKRLVQPVANISLPLVRARFAVQPNADGSQTARRATRHETSEI